jgi:hypothetical protein
MVHKDVQDSIILLAVARIFKYLIIKKLEENSADADRLDISGTNTYLCNNYTSPLHGDNDAGTGLCAHISSKHSLLLMNMPLFIEIIGYI